LKAVILLAVFILTGCTPNFIEQDIENSFILNSSPTFKGYFYVGSDNSFHYFVSKWSYENDKYFKIKKTTLRLVNEQRLGTIERQIFLFGKPSEVFSISTSKDKEVVLYAADAT